MSPPDRIAALTAREIATATQALVNGGRTRAWERGMTAIITRGHTAAALAGIGARTGATPGGAALNARSLSRAERQAIQQRVAGQLPYLRQFAAAVAGGELSDAQIAARAALYANATRATYEENRWRGKGLPAYPADGGTACLVNCKCQWVERDDGMHWERSATESCPDCISREAQWRPYRPG